MKRISFSLTLLSLIFLSPNAIAAPPRQAPQPTAAQSKAFSNLLCQRLQNGERFDTAMFRAMADLADKDENFALLLANNASGFEKIGEDAFKQCPGAMGQGMEKMPSKVRDAYFK
jgi:hypothetical protein